MLRPSRFPKTISNFRCSTVFAPTSSGGSSGMAIACASTSLTARTGSPTSCAASPSAPPTSVSSSAISSAGEIARWLQLLADGDAVTQGNQDGVEFLGGIYQPVKFLDALGIHIIRRRWPRRFSGPKRVIRDKQAPTPQLRQSRVQCIRVLVLVYVVENQIEYA